MTRGAERPEAAQPAARREEPLGSGARLRVQAEVSQSFTAAVTDHRGLVETIVRAASDILGDGCQIFLVSDEDG